MKRYAPCIVTLFSLAGAACSPSYDQSAKTPPTQAMNAASGNSCQTQANDRLALFDKPDTYPISAEEKRNAYLALYNECMKSYEPQVAGPKPNFEYAAASAPAPSLATLSPAAGGTAQGVVSAYPNGVTVINTNQLAGLSPAAGGNLNGLTTGVASNGNGNGTIVVVQSAPSAAYPVALPAPAAVPTHAAAVPVASADAPVMAPPVAADTAAYQPKPLIDSETDAQPVKPQKVARAKTRKPADDTTTVASAKDSRSRFAKNAVPVNNDLNSLSPSAGSVLDRAVTTNQPAPKD